MWVCTNAINDQLVFRSEIIIDKSSSGLASQLQLLNKPWEPALMPITIGSRMR
jgi:hypothetical protein